VYLVIVALINGRGNVAPAPFKAAELGVTEGVFVVIGIVGEVAGVAVGLVEGVGWGPGWERKM
jgi:hypothetical protein